MQSCLDPSTRPACLSDRTLDSAVKHIIKKFPNVDTKVYLLSVSLLPLFLLCAPLVTVNPLNKDTLGTYKLSFFSVVSLVRR